MKKLTKGKTKLTIHDNDESNPPSPYFVVNEAGQMEEDGFSSFAEAKTWIKEQGFEYCVDFLR